MRKLFVYYNFIIVTLLTLSGFLNATTYTQLLAASLFYPLFVYFALLVIPSRNKSIVLPKIQVIPPAQKLAHIKEDAEELVAKTLDPISDPQAKFDSDRRSFLKIIGAAGVSVFVYTLFTNRAEAAFFGSVPGPGTVSIKDSTGTKIDPAEKQPTDGYRITEYDDSVPYIYGGYVNKTGAWFISREDVTSGSYRYTKGSSSFSTNWTNRASLTYDYFDNIF
jgi:hypothetical protein